MTITGSFLDDRDIQAVMIATPLYEHAHITIDALHAGKHVFCEKSMAMTCADCLDMYNVFKGIRQGDVYRPAALV